MSNLKGAKFSKQIENIFYRLEAFGKSRYLKNDNLTHSLALSKKREMYAQDFKNYIENKGITKGKLNLMMDEKNVVEFIEKRTSNLSPKSALDYTSGFNSLLKGLEQVNITIPANPNSNDFLKNYREQFKAEKELIKFEKGRYIQNINAKLEELKNIDYNSYVIAKLQNETGLRVQEALEVTKNFDKYYNEQNSTLNGVVGKGNHQYNPKQISNSLALEIKKMDNIPKYNAYNKNLKNIGIDRSHNFRVTFAKNSLEHKLEQGVEYKTALKKVSKEINHHRAEITKYYLARC